MAEDSKDLLIDILDEPKEEVVEEKKTRKPRKKPEPRKLSDVAEEVRNLRNEGIPVPEIADRLDMSYQVVNQLVLRSYKIVSNTVEVFERQERMRLGL
jgi:DNA-binding CsgD family transcriptional regulator